MNKDNHILHVAQITLQTTSPLSIGSGQRDSINDTIVVTDANGLPALPGTALAGVLRVAYREACGADSADTLFGYAHKDSGHASHLLCTWGKIHDSKNKPVDDGIVLDERLTDELLAPLLTSLPVRQHVRLHHRGASAKGGLFDRCFVPVGYRFTFRLMLWSDGTPQRTSEWNHLLTLLQSPLFRLGGATRRGYGAMRVQRIVERPFDFKKFGDLEAWATLTPSLYGPLEGFCKPPTQNSQPVADQSDTPAASNAHPLSLDIKLEARDFWRVGTPKALRNTGKGKAADALPYRERRVQWRRGNDGSDTGALESCVIVLPASAVKGALAHRVAYHYNRLSKRYARIVTTPDSNAAKGGSIDAKDYDKSLENDAVRYWFGYAKTRKQPGGDADESGRAGRVWIDDIVVEEGNVRTQLIMHNSIDRFTGGVLDGKLFSEEAVWKGVSSLRIHIRIDAQKGKLADQNTRDALRDALKDLCNERLALGAGSARGHGYFKCPDSSVWELQWNSAMNAQAGHAAGAGADAGTDRNSMSSPQSGAA